GRGGWGGGRRVGGGGYGWDRAGAAGGQSGTRRVIVNEKTEATAATIALPPSAGGEYYVFRVEAWKGGRLVGDLYTHDSGTHSWNYRFQVHDASVPRWAYIVAGAGVLLLLFGARRAFRGVDSRRRRRRAGWLAGGTIAILVIGAVAGGSSHYDQDRERRRAESDKARVDAERQARQREIVAAFVSAAPRPAWWE